MGKGWLQAWRDDEGGVTAVEFAIVMPVFLAFVVGIFNLSLLILTVASLHYAVEKGARCTSVRENCSDAEIKSYYFAPGPAPTFVHTPDTECGHAVGASVVFQLNVVILQRDVTLSATSCFP
jgi:Flp pilus assembly protein TadG